MFRLGHLADSHTTPLGGASAAAFLNKRFWGWLSWNLRRRRFFRPEVFESLLADVKAQAPDHVAVTGDLTNVSLEQEFVHAARWLRALGAPEWVSVVPGNHDAYVTIEKDKSWDHWAPYMVSDPDYDGVQTGRAPGRPDFPTVRIRRHVALLGVCTAVPMPVFRAAGTIGSDQLGRLERCLRELRERDLCRVVMVHHPITEEGVRPSRRLTDSAPLRALLGRVGAELVLHGHRHLTTVTYVPGPEGSIPVVGVRSASYMGDREDKRAQYHLYEIERLPPSSRAKTRPRFRLHLRIRGYDPLGRRFATAAVRSL